MPRITNVDHILVLLQAQLERLERKKADSAPKTRNVTGRAQKPVERVRELAGAESLTEAEIGRALIGALLAEEFGAELGGDMSFQNLVEGVNTAIASDPQTSDLVRRAIAQVTTR